MNLVTSIDSGDCCLPNKLTEYCTDCSCKILGKKSSDTYLLTYQIPDHRVLGPLFTHQKKPTDKKACIFRCKTTWGTMFTKVILLPMVESIY